MSGRAAITLSYRVRVASDRFAEFRAEMISASFQPKASAHIP
jgi:hypothetical protein